MSFVRRQQLGTRGDGAVTDRRGKPQVFECTNCLKITGVDNLKRLVIPVIIAEASGMRVKMELRRLCQECYEDYYYFLHEEWDAQKLSKAPTNTSKPPPDPSPPPGGRGSLVNGVNTFDEQSGPSKAGAGGSAGLATNEPPAEPPHWHPPDCTCHECIEPPAEPFCTKFDKPISKAIVDCEFSNCARTYCNHYCGERVE